MSLANKIVLVTGASGGIGSAICQRFAKAGARVSAHYRSQEERARELVAGLAGGPHGCVSADLCDASAVQMMIEQVVAEMGGLDVLVNNAGIFERHPPATVGYEEWQAFWQRILATNLVAVANTSYCAARHMMEGGGGKIVNISSRGAFRGEPDSPAYGASKAGVNALSQSLAQALAPHGIMVYAVAPGFVETAMVRDYMTGELADQIRRQSPLQRVARPDDVAYWVSCLAAPEAEFATGAIIDVNGASYLRT